MKKNGELFEFQKKAYKLEDALERFVESARKFLFSVPVKKSDRIYNMSNKLLWGGLTLILAVTIVLPSAVIPIALVGAIMMILGTILLFLDK